MLKILIGGSPCTYWSISQKGNRETEPSGLGWELYKNYLIARQLFRPDVFLYENVASASALIKEKISETLGVDLVRLNSALVSAQNRDRIYGVSVPVPPPQDRHIYLRDILESGIVDREKSYTLKHQAGNARDYFKKHHTQVAFEPVRVGTIESAVNTPEHDSKQYRVYSPEGKSTTICGEGGGVGAKTGLYAVPLNPREDGKARPVDAHYARLEVEQWHKRVYSGNPHKQQHDYVAEPVPMYHYPHGFNKGGIRYHDKAMCIPASEGSICNHGIIQEYTGAGKKIYEVKNGQIEVNGVLYPINLADGLYIIRKLTVTECCRLQTLPDDYCRAVSATQGYRGLGNGWTAEIIIHILEAALRGVPRNEKIKVLSMYDGIGTGLYCLKAMGFTDIEYHAYEIDKYAITVANSNHNGIIHHGDAFGVRSPGWSI